MSTGSLNLFPGWNPFDTTRGLLSSLPPGVGIATVVKKLEFFFHVMKMKEQTIEDSQQSMSVF